MRTMIWAMALGLAAANAAAEPTTPAPGATAKATAPFSADARPIPRSIWSAEAGNVERSLQSGLQCPPRIGEYQRSAVYVFDGFGEDIDCNYVAPGRDITVYLTNLKGASLQPVYDNAKASILQVGALKHPRLIDEGRRQDEGFDWMMALYAEDEGVHSSLWMAEADGWMVQYRATYLGEDDAHMAADLSAISRQVRATAVAQLDRCAHVPAPVGTAMPVTDAKERDAAAMLLSILASAGQMAAADGKAQPQRPLTWCFDRAIALQPHPMMLWRAVLDDGADGLAVRVTPPIMEPPPALDIAVDPVMGLVDGGAGKPTHWLATITSHGRTSIFAVYRGRPDAQSAAQLMSDILAGKARLIGGYSVDGKTVILSSPQ